MRKFVFTSVIAIALTSAVSAQPLNIDFCANAGTPPVTYGAAGLAGSWNSSANGSAAALVGLNGAVIPGASLSGTALACFAPTAGPNFAVAAASANPADAQLMNDLLDGSGTWNINGLAAGTYDVIVYAAAPDSATFSTNVTINGVLDGPVVGQWSLAGGTLNFQEGITHRVRQVTIAAGQPITIQTAVASGFASLNGIQITPEPSTIGLLAFGALALIRRKR